MASKATFGLFLVVLLAITALFFGLATEESEEKTPREPAPTYEPPPPAPETEPEKILEPSAPTLALHGVVLDRDGCPVSSGVVVETKNARTRTREDGRWTLPVTPGVNDVEAFDPRTGDAACPQFAYVQDGRPTHFMLLRLRPSFVVTGRVVSGEGKPVSGAGVRVVSDRLTRSIDFVWEEPDAQDDVTTVTTDGRGRFSARLRRGPGGFAAAFDETGVVSPSRRFTPSNGGETNVGDLVLDPSKLATWTLTFKCMNGRPVEGAGVRLSAAHHLNQLLHPGYDPEEYRITADPDGQVRLTLPCRLVPVLVAYVSDSHLDRIVAIDCRRPEAREATVLLRPKPSIRARLVGSTAEALLRRDAELELPDAWRVVNRSYLIPVTDVRTGEAVLVPESDRSWHRDVSERDRAPSIMRCSGDRFVIRALEPGPRKVHLNTGRWSIQLGLVTVDSTTHDKIVELRAPGGRYVTVDCRRLQAWARAKRIGCWIPTYAAQPDEIDDEAAFAPMPGAMPLFGSRELPRLDRHVIWVPEGYNAVAFRFPKDPALTVDAGLDPAGVVMIGDRRRIDAPVPERLLSMMVPVRFVLSFRGERFRQAGIEISVSDRMGGTSLVTDELGEARVHLLPGEYSYAAGGVADRSRRRSDWPVLDVRATSKELAVEIEFEYAR